MSRVNKYKVIQILGVLLIGLAVLLSFNTYRHLINRPFPKPRETNLDLIEPWMTVKYIGVTYGVPPPELEKSVDLKIVNYKESIEMIAKKNNISTQKTIIIFKEAIKNFQISHKSPPST